MEYLIQDSDGEETAYESLLVEDPSCLSMLTNNVAMSIIKELGKRPSCAMDVARRLKMHEQKVYYHIRRLEKFGLIKLLRTEERTGGTAKIFDVVSPVVAVKLYEDGFKLPRFSNVKTIDFLRPFVEDGRLNAKIIVGSSYPHGKYNATARDSSFGIDIGTFIGNLVKSIDFPISIIDTEVRIKDLKNNLIIIGGPKVNVITGKINEKLPIYFDEGEEWAIKSTITNKTYTYDYDCVFLRMKNPFDNEKEIILIAGKRSCGTKSGVIAFTQHLNKFIEENIKTKEIAKVVEGFDKNGDGVIDSIKILE